VYRRRPIFAPCDLFAMWFAFSLKRTEVPDHGFL